MPFRHTALALLSLAFISATSASAQTSSAPVCVGGQDGSGLMPIATDCANLGRIPALSEFRFGFTNGDHHLRQLTLMPNGSNFEAAMADVGGEDPWYIEGRWYRIPEAQGGVVTAVVRGVSDIPIPPGPPNTTLVISGFEFKRADGSDANIRSIGIETFSAENKIRTTLIDDQGADFTVLAQAIAVGLAFGATGVPDPNMSFAAAGAADTLFQMGRERLRPGEPSYVTISAETPPPAPPSSGSGPAITGLITMPPGTMLNIQRPQVLVHNNNMRAYRVRVAYLWVPNSRLSQTRDVTGGERNQISGIPPGETPHVLHSFFLNFRNSDHFLGGFGVHLSGDAPKRGDVLGANQYVTYEDSNRDDPIEYKVSISNLIDAPTYRAVTPATARVTTMAPVTTTAPAPTPPAESTPAAEEEEAAAPAETPAERRARRRRGE